MYKEESSVHTPSSMSANHWDRCLHDVEQRCSKYVDMKVTPGEFAEMWRALKRDVDELLTPAQQEMSLNMRAIYTSGQPLTPEQRQAESTLMYLIEKHEHFWAIHPHWYNATVAGKISSSKMEKFITLKTLVDTDSISNAAARKMAKEITAGDD